MASHDFSNFAHWDSFGLEFTFPDDLQQVRAISTDWRADVGFQEFRNPVSVPWDVPVRTDDVQRLISGFVPERMGDKWFVYSEDVHMVDSEGKSIPGLRVHFYQSWTNIKMIELEVVSTTQLDEQGCPRSVRIRKITYESLDSGLGSNTREAWAKGTARVVCATVLCVRLGREGAEETEQ